MTLVALLLLLMLMGLAWAVRAPLRIVYTYVCKILPRPRTFAVAALLLAFLALFVLSPAADADLPLAQGNFTKRSGTGTQAVVISPAFTPKLIYFWGNTQTAVGAAVGANEFFGATSATAAAQNGSVAGANLENVATSDNAVRGSTNAVTIITIAASVITVQAEAILSSLNSDGFTLNWTTSNTSAYIVYYLAVGGTDITNVIVGNRAWATATGNQSFTGTGFLPNFIHVFGGQDGTAFPGTDQDYLRDFGAALSTSNRWTIAVSADDGDAMTPFVAGRRLVTTQMASKLNAAGAAVLAAADFVSFNADGWTWNVTTAPAAAHPFVFVAFNFASVADNVAIGTFDKCTTDPCSSDVTTGQTTPKGVLLFSRASVSGTTILDDSALSVGGSDFTNEGTVGVVHTEAADPNTNVNQTISSSKALQLLHFNGSLNAECDASVIADGFRTTWTHPGLQLATTIAYISFGEAAGAPPAGKPVRPPIVIGVNGEQPKGAESIGAAVPRSDIASSDRSSGPPTARRRRNGVHIWPAVARWRGGPLRYSERTWSYARAECLQEEFCP